MKKLLIVTVVILVAALAGWVTYDRVPGKATFTIETQKIREDAETAIEKGKDLSEGLLEKDSVTEPNATEGDSPTT